MTMTREDILKEYREAKNKNEQITILADLNTTNRNEIVDILLEMGVPEEELPKRPGRRKGVRMNKEPKVQKVQTEEDVQLEEAKNIEEKTEKDSDIIIGAIVRAAVEEEHQIEVLIEKSKQTKDAIKRHEHILGVYNKHIKDLRERTA